MGTCFGCKWLVEKPCGDGYYTTFFCWFGNAPVSCITEIGGVVIGDEERDPERCERYSKGPKEAFRCKP